MSNTDFTREPIQIVEIVQPLCSREFGVGACEAVGIKCFNTDRTCKFITALDLTDQVLMRFVSPAANRNAAADFRLTGNLLTENGEELLTEDDDPIQLQGFSFDVAPLDPSTAIPALLDVDTAPTVLNVSGGDDNMSPLGIRAVANVMIKDFPFNDVGFDPYLSDRTYDPLTQGSFWTKWLARNPFHVGYILNVYDGYFGQTLDEMTKREYSIEKIDASRSQVRITAKDILRKVTDNEVTAPRLSPGALAGDVAIGATSLLVAGAALDDYPASGRIRINDEIIQYTGRATSGSNINFTGLTRGVLNTVAAAHQQFDRVQRVLSYVNTPFSDIIYDLLVEWGGIDPVYITKADWDAEYSDFRLLYSFTGHLADPIPVQQLVGELTQQALSYIWWDERIQKIRLRAERPVPAPVDISEDGDIVADSFTIQEIPKDRASQVYVYYGLRNPVLNPRDKFSYAQGEVVIDAEAERQYGETKIKELFCRWVNTSVIASALANSYILRFRDVRKHVTFTLTAKDIDNLWTGDVASISHFMYVNADGSNRVANWLVTSAETLDQGGTYRFVAEDNESGGTLWVWVADDETGTPLDVGAWVDAAGTDGDGNVLPYGWL
jgi:hypothetical protein